MIDMMLMLNQVNHGHLYYQIHLSRLECHAIFVMVYFVQQLFRLQKYQSIVKISIYLSIDMPYSVVIHLTC